ncbi:hypothetical protein CTA1_9300 [Colletotrichum tanaceti]|uniref:Uncharacterized protein n=1 Tax=Colletotrichum tanaceti TaxID=1306861 RepID=A0A4U6XRY3_9PEZI|nr:hypothetical protein CTA1_9300 [Colletotrichum tanaceti]
MALPVVFGPISPIRGAVRQGFQDADIVAGGVKRWYIIWRRLGEFRRGTANNHGMNLRRQEDRTRSEN